MYNKIITINTSSFLTHAVAFETSGYADSYTIAISFNVTSNTAFPLGLLLNQSGLARLDKSMLDACTRLVQPSLSQSYAPLPSHLQGANTITVTGHTGLLLASVSSPPL